MRALPAAGELLVESAQGPWIVHDDGSKRLLGDSDAATWSPHGLFVAATGGRELVASSRLATSLDVAPVAAPGILAGRRAISRSGSGSPTEAVPTSASSTAPAHVTISSPATSRR